MMVRISSNAWIDPGEICAVSFNEEHKHSSTTLRICLKNNNPIDLIVPNTMKDLSERIEFLMDTKELCRTDQHDNIGLLRNPFYTDEWDMNLPMLR